MLQVEMNAHNDHEFIIRVGADRGEWQRLAEEEGIDISPFDRIPTQVAAMARIMHQSVALVPVQT